MKEIYIESSNEYKIDDNILSISNSKSIENINLLNSSKIYCDKQNRAKQKGLLVKFSTPLSPHMHELHEYISIGYRNILDIYPSFELFDNENSIKIYFKNERLFYGFKNYLRKNKYITFDLT